MNYEAVFLTLFLLAVLTGLSLAISRSPESGAVLLAVSLIRSVIVATAAVLVIVAVPLFSTATIDGEYGGPVAAFLLGMVVAALSFACERHVVTRGELPSTPAEV